MMLLQDTLLLAALAITTTLATPVNITITSSPPPQFLSKRTTPDFKEGDYTKQQITQIKQAHADAVKMASTAVSGSTTPEIFDPIFKKYFDIRDRDAVVTIFKQITGPKNDGHGNDLLGSITVVQDFPDPSDGQTSCIEHTQAELRKHTSPTLKLVVCPRGLKMGALCKSSENTPAVSHVRQLVPDGHEYTHWEALMSPVMLPAFSEKATQDEATGPWRVRRLSRHQATWNADSYAWLAQEVWWTQTCRGTHGELEEPEEKDN